MKDKLLLEIMRLKEDVKSCEITEIIPLIQPLGKSLKGREKTHLLSHIETIHKLCKELSDK